MGQELQLQTGRWLVAEEALNTNETTSYWVWNYSDVTTDFNATQRLPGAWVEQQCISFTYSSNLRHLAWYYLECRTSLSPSWYVSLKWILLIIPNKYCCGSFITVFKNLSVSDRAGSPADQTCLLWTKKKKANIHTTNYLIHNIVHLKCIKGFLHIFANQHD